MSWDVDEHYRRAKGVMPTMTTAFPDFTQARSHALETAIAEANMDLLKRKARRPSLEDELSAPRYYSVREHWRKACEFQAQTSPDIVNAIKEAVSSVEAMAQLVLGNPKITLGAAVKELRSSKRIPVGADKVVEGIWAFANATPGARHGSSQSPLVGESDWSFVRSTAEGAIRLLLDIDR